MSHVSIPKVGTLALLEIFDEVQWTSSALPLHCTYPLPRILDRLGEHLTGSKFHPQLHTSDVVHHILPHRTSQRVENTTTVIMLVESLHQENEEEVRRRQTTSILTQPNFMSYK